MKKTHTLTQLRLSYKRIRDEEPKVLASFLHTNTTLLNVSLNNNEITNKGVTLLINALKINQILIKLDLHDNRLIPTRITRPRQNLQIIY